MELIIDKIGFASLIVMFAAYFAAIVYFSALPSRGRFSPDFPRSSAVSFFQQAFYVFSFIMLLMPFISGWVAFLLVLVFYLIIFVPMIINIIVLRRDFTFDEYVKFKNSGFMSMIWKFSGIASIWIAVLAELLVFSYFNPKIPLIGWVLILYSLITALLQVALAQSVLFNARSCVYAKIITADGPIEGFVIAKGSDHYLVKTRESDILLQSGFVKSISPSNLPE